MKVKTYKVKFRGGKTGHFKFDGDLKQWEKFFLDQWAQYGHKVEVVEK